MYIIMYWSRLECQFALTLRNSGITDVHYTRMSMEDRVGRWGEL